jgi:hypothetical protein
LAPTKKVVLRSRGKSGRVAEGRQFSNLRCDKKVNLMQMENSGDKGFHSYMSNFQTTLSTKLRHSAKKMQVWVNLSYPPGKMFYSLLAKFSHVTRGWFPPPAF